MAGKYERRRKKYYNRKIKVLVKKLKRLGVVILRRKHGYFSLLAFYMKKRAEINRSKRYKEDL